MVSPPYGPCGAVKALSRPVYRHRGSVFGFPFSFLELSKLFGPVQLVTVGALPSSIRRLPRCSNAIYAAERGQLRPGLYRAPLFP
jgi:hypothetical protein